MWIIITVGLKKIYIYIIDDLLVNIILRHNDLKIVIVDNLKLAFVWAARIKIFTNCPSNNFKLLKNTSSRCFLRQFRLKLPTTCDVQPFPGPP